MGNMNKGMMSSASSEWATPQKLFDALNAIYDFELDPASTHENAKCTRHYTAEEDGLAQPWAPYSTFLNPPYGRAIGLWVAKAFHESQKGARVVCLLPARTDTRYFHKYIWMDGLVGGIKRPEVATIRFLKGRIRFSNSKNSAPFPSMIVVFKRV